MNKLIIIGAGGFGREVLQWALQSNENNLKWEVMGFLDDNLDKLDGINCSYPILGGVADWQPKSDERFVIAIAKSEDKKMVAEKMAIKGAIFENIVHKTVMLFPNAKLGCGIILCPYVLVSDNAIINDHVMINYDSHISHDAYVGAYTTICSFCDIAGNVSVGESVFIGSSACIIPSCKVGDRAFICAGSVVMNNVLPKARVLGIPAKKFEIQSDVKSESGKSVN